MDINELLKIAANKPEARNAILKLAKGLEKKAAQSNSVTKFDESVPILSQPTQEKVSGSGISGTAQQSNQSVPSMVDQAPPASTVPPGQQIAAEPMPQEQPGIDPAQEGAIAAQNFLAPIMEAAMNGDPSAQSIIAQAAGSIAKGIAEAANSAMMSMQASMPAQDPNAVAQGPAGAVSAAPVDAMAAANPQVPGQEPQMDANGNPIPVPPVQVDQNGAPVMANVPVSPEQAVADKIVPETSKGPNPPVEENSGKDGKKEKEKTKGTKTENESNSEKVASISKEHLRAIINLARMGKI